MPPSNVAPAAIVLAAARAVDPVLAGNEVCRAVFVARTSSTAALTQDTAARRVTSWALLKNMVADLMALKSTEGINKVY